MEKDSRLSEFLWCELTDAQCCCLLALPHKPNTNQQTSRCESLQQKTVPLECLEPLATKCMPVEDLLTDALTNEHPS
jgi:hypothetical protein